MTKYNHEKIDERWRKAYEESGIYSGKVDTRKKKVFITVPVIYPDGYLHLGHLYTWTRADVYARFMRMKGRNVLWPQAFHFTGGPLVGFSLRIKNKEEKAMNILKLYGVSEAEAERFAEDPLYLGNYFARSIKGDLDSAGMSIDWSKNFSLSYTPKYSKFVEWQFRRLRDLGLITQGRHPVIWCPRENTSLGDHDRLEGEGESPVAFTMIKFKLGGLVLPAATLRPETLEGATNLWVNSKVNYKKITMGNGEVWIGSAEFVDKAKYQFSIESAEDFDIKSILSRSVENPVTGESLPVLDADFVDGGIGTGIVMSVPMHAPFDLIHWNRLKKSGSKFYREAKKIIDIEAGEGFDMQKLAEDAVNDEELEKLTKRVYQEEYNFGRFNGNSKLLSGMSVRDGRSRMLSILGEKGLSDTFYETSGKVVCRCGAVGVVKVVEDQWFIRYSDEELKRRSLEAVENMEIYPDEIKAQLINAITNMEDKAATRSGGLGTKLPWDNRWTIEPLSDSTIYMAYYTIADLIEGLDEKYVDDNLFDYIFFDKKTGIDYPEAVEEMKRSFKYWYPVDMRVTAKELVPNHIAFFIMNHVALFKREFWPKGLSINGWLVIDKAKMSKSKGNVEGISHAVEKYGADATRLIVSASNGIDDAEWNIENIKGFVDRVEFLLDLVEVSNDFTGESALIDGYISSKLKELAVLAESDYEHFRYRSAVFNAFFRSVELLRLYLDFGGKNRETVRHSLDIISKLIHPVFPFISEEINEKIGGRGLIESYASWPDVAGEERDTLLEGEFGVLEATIEDIRNLIKILKVEPKEIRIGIAERKKFEVYNEVVDRLREDRNIGNIYKEFGADEFIKKLLKNPNKLPNERRDHDIELKVMKEAEGFLSRTFRAKIQVSESKDVKALPGKPKIEVI
ncbi:MAG: leucine--tRNA ligase [Candidatus Parvarchaeota archaeon]|nr:leucine--tRNA ligase [Candidatus Parvarchaeota archaeon]